MKIILGILGIIAIYFIFCLTGSFIWPSCVPFLLGGVLVLMCGVMLVSLSLGFIVIGDGFYTDVLEPLGKWIKCLIRRKRINDRGNIYSENKKE